MRFNNIKVYIWLVLFVGIKVSDAYGVAGALVEAGVRATAPAAAGAVGSAAGRLFRR
jgi:hypothetical protein